MKNERKNKISFYWIFPILAAIIIIVNYGCKMETDKEEKVVTSELSEPVVTQTVEYKENCMYCCDTLDDGAVVHVEVTGYFLITESKDFDEVDFGDMDYIDSMKCIRYEEIEDKQLQFDKLNNENCCDEK